MIYGLNNGTSQNIGTSLYNTYSKRSGGINNATFTAALDAPPAKKSTAMAKKEDTDTITISGEAFELSSASTEDIIKKLEAAKKEAVSTKDTGQAEGEEGTDPLKEIREQIENVQEQLQDAQERLAEAQADAKVSKAQSQKSKDPDKAAVDEAMGALGENNQVKAIQMEIQMLNQQLMMLNDQLKEAMK